MRLETVGKKLKTSRPKGFNSFSSEGLAGGRLFEDISDFMVL